jgi:hypothetical protein
MMMNLRRRFDTTHQSTAITSAGYGDDPSPQARRKRLRTICAAIVGDDHFSRHVVLRKHHSNLLNAGRERRGPRLRQGITIDTSVGVRL